jgi:hypothetical protein
MALAQGQNWMPTAAVLGTTAGMIALDATEGSYFRSGSFFSGAVIVPAAVALLKATVASETPPVEFARLRKQPRPGSRNLHLVTESLHRDLV